MHLVGIIKEYVAQSFGCLTYAIRDEERCIPSASDK